MSPTEERKLGAPLARRIEELVRAGRESEELDLLVTLQPGTDAPTLERRGMRVGRVIARINVVAGSARAVDVSELEREPGVVSIELDSGMHALEA